jgi:hypothetical protein
MNSTTKLSNHEKRTVPVSQGSSNPDPGSRFTPEAFEALLDFVTGAEFASRALTSHISKNRLAIA